MSKLLYFLIVASSTVVFSQLVGIVFEDLGGSPILHIAVVLLMVDRISKG